MILIKGNYVEKERSHFTNRIDQLGNTNDKLLTNVCEGGYRKHHTTTHPHYAITILCLRSNLCVHSYDHILLENATCYDQLLLCEKTKSAVRIVARNH